MANPQGDNHSILGLITLAVQEAINVESSYVLIQELCVHPDRRSQNIGDNLMQAVETYSRQQGIYRIEVCLPTHEFLPFLAITIFIKRVIFMILLLECGRCWNSLFAMII